ncbi:hypothetical protein [Granulosicoccus antarcticus]|uniref:Uncharacterized protein n=1 Tax=Granulosicoccus antarcticus IMCC3135 TaxID=1192854 RepID=A0A2Z2NUV5_9GAMM|nr:hypothetical protein [Granulosicoccus antarcticus]ASJ71447.1 hypothetical protein IMCC3135_06700 [Granulosicoccus antarcticus IMCC3135]
MAETLLSISEVLLYGETVTDMKYKDKDGDPARYFVRVYGFSHEGGYYGMVAPVIMLLEGKGASLAASTPEDVRNSYSSDIRQWQCDKSDHSARLDELTGSIEDILLDIEIGDDGQGGRVSGGRVSGGRVSGGRVSGGRVSGGRVSGGRVSGGKSD